ncbi:GNAT family N-acetyltransferase [Chryseobacterium indologenes]|uniref:GNAT family N-acetyltransferase n=3 Tax=Chryseobacterium group TaxID=2782232 RepID=A0AAD1DUD5_CHRID|nr:GNAT family N-acetyltransferase [Chryseobacterium indologenes]AZB16979.1 GNAT family N-acetyltransferase [Chryseobacterium indologenes]GAE65171.1 putative acetyltransferase [Chryseobacterium indologenes NBRC 14944]
MEYVNLKVSKNDMSNIIFKINEKIEIKTIKDLFFMSDYLPISNMNDDLRLQKMFDNANLVVSAWSENKLVGIARSLCDFSYCCYLSDICVNKEFRHLNIGKRLIEITREHAGKECKIILHSSEDALNFYDKIGMKRISEAFIIQRDY